MSSEFIHDAEARRYLLKVDGKLMSAADYTVNGDRLAITHTFTDPMHRKQGYAGQVVSFAVDDIEKNSPELKIVPMCWYAAKWFDEHPEKSGLLAG